MKTKNLLIPLFVMSLCLVSCNNNNGEEVQKPNEENEQAENDNKPEETVPTPQPDPVAPASEIYAKAIAADMAYNGNATFTITSTEAQEMVVLDHYKNPLTDAQIKDVLKIDPKEAKGKFESKDITTFDKENNSIDKKSFIFDDEKNKFVSNPGFSTCRKINDKFYGVDSQNDSDINYTILSDDHIEKNSNLSIYNYISDMSYEEPNDLDKLQHAIEDYFIYENDDFITTIKTEEEKDGVYTVSYTYKEDYAQFSYECVKDLLIETKITFTELGITNLSFEIEGTICFENRFIGTTDYALCGKMTNKNNISFEKQINDDAKLTEEELTKVNNITNETYINKPTSNLVIRNIYMSHQSTLNFNEKYINNIEHPELSHVTYKYYDSPDYTNEIDIANIKGESYDQTIYEKIIPDDGYALVIESINEDYEFNAYKTNFKEIKISDAPKYVYKTSMDEEFTYANDLETANKELKNKEFTTILKNSENINGESEFNLENGGVYYIYYSIDNRGIFGKK